MKSDTETILRIMSGMEIYQLSSLKLEKFRQHNFACFAWVHHATNDRKAEKMTAKHFFIPFLLLPFPTQLSTTWLIMSEQILLILYLFFCSSPSELGTVKILDSHVDKEIHKDCIEKFKTIWNRVTKSLRQHKTTSKYQFIVEEWIFICPELSAPQFSLPMNF